ncbi:MAG: 34 kDa antigenic family protein, partial [Rhodococcus sp.]|nr:34 kDa antigenic family protein [Rhodococcus sp. (in: high G+C Gram-positive bacteria)]
MTYPSGGPNYGSPAQPTPQSEPAPSTQSDGSAGSSGTASSGPGLTLILTAVTAGLGVIVFFFGLAPFLKGGYGGGANSFEARNYGLGFLLLGGVLAGVSLLPKQKLVGAVAATSVTGFLVVLFTFFNVGDVSLG